MQLSATKTMRLTALLFALLAFGLLGSSAHAQDAARIAHRALRDKILGDAHDRYGVRFGATRVRRSSGRGQEVTGRGSFLRRGKSSQQFTYHVVVNPRRRETSDVSYDIR